MSGHDELPGERPGRALKGTVAMTSFPGEALPGLSRQE